MINKEQEFHNVFVEEGGRYPLQNLDYDMRGLVLQIYNDLISTINSGFLSSFFPNLKNVYIDFINNQDHNAQANIIDFKCIGINIGLVNNLYKISSILVGTKELFQDLPGDNELYSINELMPFFKNSFEEIPNLRIRSKELNEERALFAAMILTIQIYFIIGHEYCHVLQHDKIIKSILKSNVASEFYDNKLFDSETILTLKTLEIDADRFGSLFSFALAINLYESNDSLLQNYFSGPSYIWMTSILSLLLSFEQARKSYYPDKLSYHPDVYIRQSFAMNYIRTIITSQIFTDFYETNYKPDFDITLVHQYEEIEFFFGKLGFSKNKLMEKEFQLLISNLRFIQDKYL